MEERKVLQREAEKRKVYDVKKSLWTLKSQR